MEQKINNYTEGPILGPLLRFSLPVLLALLLQSLYGAVDLLIVGKFAATQDVSGVSVGSQLMMTASSFVSSMAMGTTILLGQKIGMGDERSGGRIIGATVGSQTVSVLISLWVLSRRKLPFSFGWSDILHPDWRMLGRIVRFGTPIALQDFMVGFSFLVNLSIVNKLGLNASAGVGVAEKVCMIIMLVPIAFMQSMSAYVAQNYGAKRIDRAVKGLRVSILFFAILKKKEQTHPAAP